MLNLIVAPKKHVANGEKYVKKIVKYLKAEKVEYSVYFSLNFENLKESVKQLISYGENEFVIVGDDLVINLPKDAPLCCLTSEGIVPPA